MQLSHDNDDKKNLYRAAKTMNMEKTPPTVLELPSSAFHPTNEASPLN